MVNKYQDNKKSLLSTIVSLVSTIVSLVSTIVSLVSTIVSLVSTIYSLGRLKVMCMIVSALW